MITHTTSAAMSSFSAPHPEDLSTTIFHPKELNICLAHVVARQWEEAHVPVVLASLQALHHCQKNSDFAC